MNVFSTNPLALFQEINNAKISVERLTELASHPYKPIRRQVANKGKLEPETYLTLAADKDWVVRKNIAANPITPPEAIRMLVDDENRFVLMALAKHKSLSEDGTRKLLDKNNPLLEQAIAKHTVHETILNEIVDNLENYPHIVREHLLQNPALSPSMLDIIAKKSENLTHVRVAVHKNTSPETLVWIYENTSNDIAKLKTIIQPFSPLWLAINFIAEYPKQKQLVMMEVVDKKRLEAGTTQEWATFWEQVWETMQLNFKIFAINTETVPQRLLVQSLFASDSHLVECCREALANKKGGVKPALFNELKSYFPQIREDLPDEWLWELGVSIWGSKD